MCKKRVLTNRIAGEVEVFESKEWFALRFNVNNHKYRIIRQREDEVTDNFVNNLVNIMIKGE